MTTRRLNSLKLIKALQSYLKGLELVVEETKLAFICLNLIDCRRPCSTTSSSRKSSIDP